MKLMHSETSYQELSENTIVINFGQVFQKLWQYKGSLIFTTRGAPGIGLRFIEMNCSPNKRH